MSHELRSKYFGTDRDAELWVTVGRGTRVVYHEGAIPLGRVGQSNNLRYITQTDSVILTQPASLSDIQFAQILLNRLAHG